MNSKGTLKVCRVHHLNEHKSMINFVIVRHLIFPINNTTHLPELAPNEDLFRYLNRAKRMGNLEEINKGLDMFRKNIKGSNYKAVMSMVQQEFLDKGFNVTLMCYCSDVNTCHRKIVAEEFEKLGYNVEIY